MIFEPVRIQQAHLHESPVQGGDIMALGQKKKIPLRISRMYPGKPTRQSAGISTLSRLDNIGVEIHHELNTGQGGPDKTAPSGRQPYNMFSYPKGPRLQGR